jgi:7-carboxy-7-deazaguanine synthase
MRLNEMYPAFQGEGPDIGVESVFIRLQFCPVRCAWCDTKFTWDGSESGEAISPAAIANRALAIAAPLMVGHFVITGGEPSVHPDLPELVECLTRDVAASVEIETSGAVVPPDGMGACRVSVNISPKLPSAVPKLRPDPLIICAWLDVVASCRFKFVVNDDADWHAMELLLGKLPSYARAATWVSPQAQTRDELAVSQAWLLQRASGSGLRVTTRMHITAHETKRRT